MSEVTALTRSAGSLAKAALVGAKTVKGPSPENYCTCSFFSARGKNSKSTSESVSKAGLDGEVDEGGGSVPGELLHDVPSGPGLGLHHRCVVADTGDVIFVT